MSTTFKQIGLSVELIGVLDSIGFKEPTEIQEKCIPILLGFGDLIGQSRTGSGKTAAFALPILQKLSLDQRDTQALILCPTRELAAQVARDVRRFGRNQKGLQVLVLSGGEPARPQREALARGVHVVVGTPGRVLDLLMRGDLDTSYLKTLVLDEADRMLDMGFEEDVKEILTQTPGTRQTVFFSATFPEEVKFWSRKHQINPVHIKIEEDNKASLPIHQYMIAAENEEKTALLLRLLETMPGTALVFCNQKARVSELIESLEIRKIEATALHGDLEQRDRDRVLAMFRNGSRRVLVATDVAARGLDIADLDMVICFDVPFEPSVHTHRVGRTGRAGKTGLAVSLANVSERRRLDEFSFSGGFKIELVQLDQLQKLRPKPRLDQPSAAMQTLYVSGGRKDKLRPGDLLGALTGEAGQLKSSDIGKIEIHDNFSYVAIAKPVAGLAAERLRAGKIKGRKFLVKLID